MDLRSLQALPTSTSENRVTGQDKRGRQRTGPGDPFIISERRRVPVLMPAYTRTEQEVTASPSLSIAGIGWGFRLPG
jgi:hypothetical protein